MKTVTKNLYRNDLISVVTAVAACVGLSAFGQGAFQNLDFEEANIAGLLSTNSSAADLFSGWELFLGITRTTVAGADAEQNKSLPYINIYDEGLGFYYPVIQGSYSALLSSIYSSSSNGSVTLSQTGLVAPGTQSIQLDANENQNSSFVVTLGGETINMVPVQTFSSYTLYGCNISGWGGRVATLTITQLASQEFSPATMELDNIVFSPTTVTAEPPPQTGLLYVTNADGASLTITGYSGILQTYLVIPSAINWLTVTAIGDGAFVGITDLNSITIPSTVTTIGEYAFNDSGLTSVTIPYGITNIGFGAFLGCELLTNAIIPESVTTIGSSAFSDTGLLSAFIPGSVTNFGGGGVFDVGESLTNVVIEPGITSLAGGVLGGNPNLSSVIIPASVTNIQDDAFSGCVSLAAAFFMGNAPAVDNTSFLCERPGPPPISPLIPFYPVTAYYLPGTTGWAEFQTNTYIPPFNDPVVGPLGNIYIPVVMWNPIIQSSGTNYGIQNGQYGFDITATTNLPIAIEACDDLTQTNWIVLQRLTLTNGLYHFSETFNTNKPARFYRIGFP